MTDPRTLHTLSLVATLRAATTAGHAIAERRAGRDPSGQEAPPVARAGLAEAAGRIVGRLVRLRLRLAVGPAGGSAAAAAGVEDDAAETSAETAALVQAFEDRILAADLARDLHLAHQRLLSLYPAVGAELVEAVRLRQREAEALAGAGGEAFEGAAGAFVERAADTLDDLREALRAG